MDLKDIINEIKKRGFTGYKIAESTGLTQVGVDKILNGTSKTPQKKTLKLLEDFLNKSYASGEDINIIEIPKPQQGVPYYDVDFTASFLEVTNNQATQPDSYIDHPFFRGCDCVVRNSGQSMAKLISHGDAIGLVKINNWMEFFPFGEVYAIVTDDGFRMVKIITEGKTDDTYTLVSKPTESKKEDFPPQQIKKSSISAIFRVQASSHLF
ncbi:helix-turn-helix transcriptional regulator [Flavobacterium sp. LB2P84]|uniref:LexA family transcriptional regulator n=1 Tax=Flavobacterium yafengii TaxID=3041253 RepID=UPI0024A8580B|nr:helix-turn-helix transcriptional regulator [Flavobacterium yafengii]MDI6034025.1 helix-turn-helix transcriptional regulator [Flavobacterium yafengii]